MIPWGSNPSPINSSLQPPISNSIFLSHYSSSSLPNTMKAALIRPNFYASEKLEWLSSTGMSPVLRFPVPIFLFHAIFKEGSWIILIIYACKCTVTCALQVLVMAWRWSKGTTLYKHLLAKARICHLKPINLPICFFCQVSYWKCEQRGWRIANEQSIIRARARPHTHTMTRSPSCT